MLSGLQSFEPQLTHASTNWPALSKHQIISLNWYIFHLLHVYICEPHTHHPLSTKCQQKRHHKAGGRATLAFVASHASAIQAPPDIVAAVVVVSLVASSIVVVADVACARVVAPNIAAAAHVAKPKVAARAPC